ncbi:MAG: M48 family metalloprotease [Acidobacteriota bacterium]
MRSLGDRAHAALLVVIIVVGLAAGTGVSAQGSVKLDAYAEWKRDGALIVDGQRVMVDGRTRWKGTYRRVEDVPLGDEVRVSGTRRGDGVVVAREIDVRPNGNALFESEVQQGSAELERLWLRNGEAFEAADDGKKIVIGEISERGARVNRVRRLVERLAPPYVDQGRIRVYVIDNKEWNAMAMGNGAIWVFSGIMDDMPDEDLAIVVGHELAHYTHEHSRRQMRRGIWTGLGGLAALLAAEAIDSDALRTTAQVGAALTLSALTSGYGRDLEDQADRVGLRYAYEAGFNVKRAPGVWGRFLEKYGEGNRLTNFFFSDHSQASARRRNLEAEIRHNGY